MAHPTILKQKCRVCRKIKKRDNFYKTPAGNLRKECKACTKKRVKEYYEANREAQLYRRWLYRIKTLYGVTKEDYLQKLAEQDGRCAICRTDDPGQRANEEFARWQIDHDHKTMEFRGLLCGSCNMGLGNFGDSVKRLEAAILYLQKGSAPTATRDNLTRRGTKVRAGRAEVA